MENFDLIKDEAFEPNICLIEENSRMSDFCMICVACGFSAGVAALGATIFGK